MTPAAEAPRVDVDGRSELNTNQTSAKLSHDSVLFNMLGNMLLTKLQTDLNTLEWDVDIRCDLCRCEFTWGVGDESVAQFERSFVYNWIMALDFLETHTLYENHRLCQCWRAVPKGFDRSRRSFRSHHFGIPWQHDVPSAQNAPGWWRRLTIVRLCSSMFFWYPENDDIALFFILINVLYHISGHIFWGYSLT